MAKHTKFPAAAPPVAPERVSTARLMLRAYVIFALAVCLGHTAVYNLLGHNGAIAALGVLTLATAGIWIPGIARSRPVPLEWRRFPWAVFAYCALAVLSLAWSEWPMATAITGVLLLSVTMTALMIGHMLSWREILLALSSALKWVLGLSVAIELWVALVVGHPILPNFFDSPGGTPDPHWYWVRGNLIDGGRIQGIVGNANQLAVLCLMAMIVFCVLYAARVRWRTTLALWALVAAYLFVRAGSATMFVAAGMVVFTLVVALLIRRYPGPGARTLVYGVALGGTAVAGGIALIWRAPLLEVLGRSGDLTGRIGIWQQVSERAQERPVLGWGFSSPWIPTEPAIHEWIVDKGITVFTAHNMWLDVRFQLGWIGVAAMAFIWATLLWRTWFFAVDRPRWDLQSHRPFSPLTLAPSLICVMLLVQGLAESGPIMLWGWLCVVLFSFKVKAVPLLGVGLSERERVIDRGKQRRRVP